jgi:predicted transcriptional regulator
MKSAGKARSNGLYRHIRTSKEIIRNLLNDSYKENKQIKYKQEQPLSQF